MWPRLQSDCYLESFEGAASESRIHHQHGCKVNRPVYVRGQNWVTLALVLPQGWRSLALPMLSRLSRSTGNSGKLIAAKTLLRVAKGLFADRIVTLLVDSWYMRKSLLLPAQALGYQVIGQMRKDTALYLPPPTHNGKRGRPRKYGDKLTAERIAELPMISQKLFLYGQWQTVHYCSCIARARFLEGQQVRAVWSQIENKDGTLRQPRLILCTDLSLSAIRTLLAYNRRWSIEDLFNQLKNRWGWKDAWQQTRQVLHRWTQILSTSYALPQLLAQMNSEQVKELASISPWRHKQPITAGRVRQGLRRIFSHVDIRSHWHPKSGKFTPQNRSKKPDRPPDKRKIA